MTFYVYSHTHTKRMINALLHCSIEHHKIHHWYAFFFYGKCVSVCVCFSYENGYAIEQCQVLNIWASLLFLGISHPFKGRYETMRMRNRADANAQEHSTQFCSEQQDSFLLFLVNGIIKAIQHSNLPPAVPFAQCVLFFIHFLKETHTPNSTLLTKAVKWANCKMSQ